MKERRHRVARHPRRWSGLRGGLTALLVICLAASSVSAQLVVSDPAVTARNAITAMVKESLLNLQREQHVKLRRMARRLSVHTNLDKYAVADPPRWRTHGGDYQFAGPYN